MTAAQHRAPRMLMLGNGWFPEHLGGLDRYFRDLVEQMPEARAVVVGPAAARPPRVVACSAHYRWLPLRVAAVWRAARREAADVEVVDSHFALYALLPLVIGPLRRRPVVGHFHGPWADENVAAGDRSAIRRCVRRAIERTAYRRYDRSVVLTSAFRRALVERYGVSPWSVEVVAPGVDLQRFTPAGRVEARAALGLEPEAFVAVSVRRLVPRMGVDLLIDAWADAVGTLPPASRLLIAGRGPERGALERRIAGHGISGSVALLGGVTENKLVELYRAADIGVVPSRAHEGFGLVVIEAAACGTPSLVTAAGGLPEAIASLDAGLVVPANDRTALTQGLVRAVARRPERVATRAYAEQFSWQRAVETHRRIARQILDGGSDERLRVVYVDHVARLSGGEIALLRLLPHLDMVHPHVVLAEEGPLVDRLALAGISCEVLPLHADARSLRKADVHGSGVSALVAAHTGRYVLRLARRLRHLRPDVVHTNSLKAGVYGSVAARAAGVPVVWHVRDRIADDYLPAPAVRLIRAMMRNVPDAVVANSSSTLAAALPRQARRHRVAPSVLPDVIDAVEPVVREADGALRYGVIGRLAPWKGQDMFLRAFARAFPYGAEEVVVVGAALFGEDAYAVRLRVLSDELGLGGRVEFRGHRDDVWAELARIDVLVHSSVLPEPFGQVVVEAMAAGVPVIAAADGGPGEILRHDQTALLYTRGDVDALAAALVRTRSSRLRARLRAAAMVDVGRFDPRLSTPRWHALYAALAASPRRSPRRAALATPTVRA